MSDKLKAADALHDAVKAIYTRQEGKSMLELEGKLDESMAAYEAEVLLEEFGGPKGDESACEMGNQSST